MYQLYRRDLQEPSVDLGLQIAIVHSRLIARRFQRHHITAWRTHMTRRKIIISADDHRRIESLLTLQVA
jgi:hypothetical protein